jgi:hypothetical protein
VLQHLGFPRAWLDWISILLSTASTKVLLNGSPGDRICHAKGLQQGDPLSPMLILLVMEVLNALVCMSEGVVSLARLGTSVNFSSCYVLRK